MQNNNLTIIKTEMTHLVKMLGHNMLLIHRMAPDLCSEIP